MEFFYSFLIMIPIWALCYNAGCYHISTKEEIVKKEQKQNTEAVLYCKNYCKELSSKSFSYSPSTGCSCNFGIETKK